MPETSVPPMLLFVRAPSKYAQVKMLGELRSGDFFLAVDHKTKEPMPGLLMVLDLPVHRDSHARHVFDFRYGNGRIDRIPETTLVIEACWKNDSSGYRSGWLPEFSVKDVNGPAI